MGHRLITCIYSLLLHSSKNQEDSRVLLCSRHVCVSSLQVLLPSTQSKVMWLRDSCIGIVISGVNWSSTLYVGNVMGLWPDQLVPHHKWMNEFISVMQTDEMRESNCYTLLQLDGSKHHNDSQTVFFKLLLTSLWQIFTFYFMFFLCFMVLYHVAYLTSSFWVISILM